MLYIGDLTMTMGKCCFAYRNYDRCAQLCKEILPLPEAELLRGKSLYHIYRTKQRKLRMYQVSMPQKDFYTEHKACYDIVKEVIKLLGHAVDNKAVADASIKKMLDFAMLDYMLEANKLKDVGRCFLCLKREEQDSPTATADDSKQSLHEAEEVAKPNKSKKSAKKIHASHLIPQSAIKRLANQDPAVKGEVSKNILFGAFGTKLKDTVQRTPGTCTLYMLCTSCEHMLNVKGEQPFLRIFEKLYDPASHNEECEVLYGEELYHFCVGLIFRTLCPSPDDYINTAEVYQLLVNCRKFLMVDNPVHMVNEMSSIYFFICPTDEPDFDEAMRLFMVENSASYTSKVSLDCPLEGLGTFESVLANFFMIKLGIFIVLVKFSPMRMYDIPERFLVNPRGGSYSIPTHEQRKGVLPLGVWTALNLLHQIYKDDLDKVNTDKKK